jgi:hypothetical protein
MGYRPISGLAIAALGVAVMTAVIVLVIIAVSLVKGRAILADWVVALAVLGLTLSVIARWQIRRSEGTRAGLGLTSTAIWLCLILGLGYAAFLAATQLAVRKQAQAVADQWFGLLAASKPELAFRLTRDPSQQSSIPLNEEAIRRRFGATELAAFIRSDLSRFYRSWDDRVRAEWIGVKQLQATAAGYEVELNYLLRSPEGRFDVGVGVQGSDDPNTGERIWQIAFGRTRVRDRQSTRLGQICDELQYECFRRFLPEWLDNFQKAPESKMALFHIDGNVPPEAQREQLVKELQLPLAINAYPGGPTQPAARPLIRVSADAVRLISYVEMNLPTLGLSLPGYVTVEVTDEKLVKDIVALQGPGWEQQPTQPSWDVQLKDYKGGMKVVDVNLRPSAVREGPIPQQMGR